MKKFENEPESQTQKKISHAFLRPVSEGFFLPRGGYELDSAEKNDISRISEPTIFVMRAY